MLWVLWLKTWISLTMFLQVLFSFPVTLILIEYDSRTVQQDEWRYYHDPVVRPAKGHLWATGMEDDGEEHGKEDMWMEVVSDWPRGHLPTPETWAELFPALILWILWINSSIFWKTPSFKCRWHLVSGNACKPTSGWASQRCEYYWHERLWSSRCGHVCNHCNRGHCQALPKIGTLGWGNGRC